MKKNNLIFLIFSFFVAHKALAARIIGHHLNPSQKTVTLKIAYQACNPLDFYVQVLSCGREPEMENDEISTSNTDKIFMRAALIASEETPTCDTNREQFVDFNYGDVSVVGNDCDADELFIKATSSKVPYLISIH